MLCASVAAAACNEPPRVGADTARPAAPSERPVTRVPDSSRASRPDSAHARASDSIVQREDAALPAIPFDSTLPRPSYPQLPGWLVVGFYPGEIQSDTTPVTEPVITIYPFDSAWARVDRRRPFTLLLASGTVTAFSRGRVGKDEMWDGTDLSVRFARPASRGKSLASWLLPADTALEASALRIHDSLSADGNLRTWTAGPVKLVLRRVSKTSARLYGEQPGSTPIALRLVTIDTATDRDMGADSPAMLSLSDDWRLPHVGAAFRLGKAGPIVVVMRVSGYECQNYHVVVFSGSVTTVLDEPHYYYCQQ